MTADELNYHLTKLQRAIDWLENNELNAENPAYLDSDDRVYASEYITYNKPVDLIDWQDARDSLNIIRKHLTGHD